MKQLSRKKIQDMIDLNGVNIGSRRSSGGSGGAGGGGVSSAWVDEHYVSKDFFARLFTINGTTTEGGVTTDVVVEPNDLETTITNIQAMVGLWTEQYLSALGIGSGGGGGGGVLLTEPLASINEAGMGTPSGANKVIAWNGNTWTYMPYTTGSGTVTSVTMTVPTGFKVSNGDSQTINNSGTFALTFGGTITKNQVLASPAAANGTPAWRALVADDIPTLTAAKISDITLTNGTLTIGNNSITPLTDATLKSDYSWWGGKLDATTKKREGNMSNVGNISFSDTGKNIGSVAYFDTTNHRLGIGSSPGAYKLDVNGDIRTSGNLYIGGTNRILSGSGDSAKNLLEFDGTHVTLAYGFRASNETRIYGQNISMYHGSTLKVQVTSTGLKIGDATLSWDSTNHALKIDTGFYSESFISALGAGSGGGGGGVLLTEPLASINEAGMGTPSGANKVIAWNGNTWTYMPYTTGSGTVTSVTMTVPTGFKVSNGDSQTINNSGTFALTFGGTITKNKVLASPAAANGTPAWRALVADDIPTLTAAKISDITLTNGTLTIGNNSITPITDAKLKSDYSWWGGKLDATTKKREGNMSNVGNISFSDTGKNIGSVAYFDTTNHRLGIGSSPGAYKLDVNGDIRTSGNLYIGGTNRILSGSGDSAKNLLEFDGTHVTLAYGFRASNETRIYGQNISMYHGSTLKVQVTSTGLKIGDATLSWDSTNHALKIDTGFYSESFISALGAGSGGGSGSGMTEDQMWVALGTNGQAKQITLTHLTLALNGYAKTADVTKKLTIHQEGQDDIEYNGTAAREITISAGGFEMKSVTNATLKGLSGTFGFYGYNLPDNDKRNYDWVGIQVGTTNDKWQLMAHLGHLMVRQNDNGGSSSTGWVPGSSVESSGWYTVLDSGNYKSVIGNTYSTKDTKDTAGAYQKQSTKLYLVGTESFNQEYAVTNINGSVYINSVNNLCAPKFETVSSNSSGFCHRLETDSQGYGGLSVKGSNVNAFFAYISPSLQITLGNSSFGNIVRVYSSNTIFYSVNNGTATECLRTLKSGNIVISNGLSSDPGYKLYVDGTGYFNSTLRINAGIEAPNGDGLLVYAPASGWTGISSSQWGVGCVSKQGVIRSSNTDLIHYKNGIRYTILDTTNGVTLDTTQDISGAKSFTADIRCKKSNASIYVCQMIGANEVKKVGLNSDTNRGVWDFSYGAWLIGNDGTSTFLNVGKVGIGTTSPSAKLHVDGSGYFSSSIGIAGIDQYHALYVNGNTRLGGNVGIGASAQSGYKLYVNGETNINGDVDITKGKTIYFQHTASGVPEISIGTKSNDQNLYLKGVNLYFNGSIISSSDMRLKDVDELVDGDVESIARAPIFNYRWKKTPEFGLHLGSSAQYWQNVFSCAVIKDEEGYLGLDYAVTALASAIITARKVVNHEERIKALEAENERLRNEIEQLKVA